MKGNSITIGFAGMTHLAIVSSIVAAERGFSVVGFGQNEAELQALRSGEFEIHEPGLREMAAKNRARLRYTSNVHDLAAVDLCFVAPDVPTDDAGIADLGPVSQLLALVESGTSSTTPLIVLSQVPPGFTRGIGGAGRQVFYQVETLVFGQAIARAMSPERFVIGAADPGLPLPEAYQAYLRSFGCPILPMRYESAELAKVAINMFLVSSVTTTNVLAELCERIGADWAEIAPALRLDRRIGPHAYLAPGLGIAGGNLERDLATVQSLGSRHGTSVGLVAEWLGNSRHRRDWALERLRERMPNGMPARIGLWGLAYKQDTASTKNSPALNLLARLPPSVTVRAFDPVVTVNGRWHSGLQQALDPLDACRDADALVVMTPWQAFSEVAAEDVAAALRQPVVIDPYGTMNAESCRAAGLVHLQLGRPTRG